MVYTVTLNPSLDYVMKVEHPAFNKTNRSYGEYIVPGGKGLNISILLSRLRISTTALGFVAGFTGCELQRLLQKEGLNCDFTMVDKGFTRINVKLSSGEITEFNGSGIEVGEQHISALTNKIKKLKSGDWLCLSGSIPKGAKPSIYKELSKAAPKGVKIVLDTVEKSFTQALETKPFLVKPNREELEDIFGKSIKTESDVILFGMKLKALGAQNVLISLGGDGAVLLSSDGEIHTAKVPKGTPKNTVAAGDSMIAGFIKEFESSADFGSSLNFSVASGSATAYSDWLADSQLIDKLFKEMEKTNEKLS